MSEESTFNHIFQTKTIPPFCYIKKQQQIHTHTQNIKQLYEKHIISTKFKWKFVVSCAQTIIKSSCW